MEESREERSSGEEGRRGGGAGVERRVRADKRIVQAHAEFIRGTSGRRLSGVHSRSAERGRENVHLKRAHRRAGCM